MAIPCPRCTYQASSVLELEVHGKDTHWRAEKTTAAQVETLTRWVQPVELPRFEITPGLCLPALSVPPADPYFYMDEDTVRFLSAIAERSRRGDVVNVLLVGPTGAGKSSLPGEFAARWRRPFLTMHCQMIAEQGDWWGTMELSPERGTHFHRAALVDAIETPGCVILLDEANRTHPENLNVLFGLLDHRRRAGVPALHREVAVAPGVVFFLTLNEGLDYVGTNAVDRALRDRVSNTIRLNYPPKAAEKELLVKRIGIETGTAGKLVNFAGATRQNPKLAMPVSTRQLLECAALIREGLLLQDAVLFAVINGATEEAERKALLQCLQVTGEVAEAYRVAEDDEEDR